jgi:hypothetical protein
MTFYCTQCRRDKLDVMIDGEIEMMDATSVCTKCFYSDWTNAELREIEENNRLADLDMNGDGRCGCGRCEYCLDVEPRSMNWRC